MRHSLIACVFAICLSSFQATLNAGTFVVASDAAQIRLMLELRAQQFLNRATFGAKDTEIAALADQMAAVGITTACSNWIDAQFALPPTLHIATMKSFMAADGITAYNDATKNLLRYRYHAFWHNAIAAPDQLKQRLAWALIQICVVGEGGENFNNVDFPAGFPDKPYWFGMGSYYDILLNRCDDTYRDVLQDVTYHPIMGTWLSSLRNQKTNAASGTFPDENYAREIMQLLSIGLNELNIDGTYKLDSEGEVIPTYDNEIIKEFAKVFTGFNYASGNGTSITSGYLNLIDPMIMTNSAHETGPKVLVSGTIPGNANGNIDITDGLNNLYAHPNVAPFISRMLIQRLVRSNPSKGYISRVATVFNNNGAGVKGDMKAVVKAILIDDEAWTSLRITRLRNPTRLVVTGAGTEFGRLVEPVVQYASFFRRYGVPPTTNGGKFYLNATPGTWNQAPFRSPSVFNFYLPHHQPSGGMATAVGSRNIPNADLFAPEFQLLTAVVSNSWQNRTRADVTAESITQGLYTDTTVTPNVAVNAVLPFDFATEKTLAADPVALVEYLDRVLCNGTMTDDYRSRLSSSIITNVPQTNTNPNRDRDRMRGALMTVMNSPCYLIRY
ncbi:MAG: DUF1800 family protein [Pirellula sp.]